MIVNNKQQIKNYYAHLPVLVTGGAGFIGSHLTSALVDLGAQVTILDNLSTGNFDNLSPIWDSVAFIKESISNFETCLKATYGKKIVFHLAAHISVPDSLEKPKDCFEININGLSNLLEACRLNKVERFIFSSSSAVYGSHKGPCLETITCRPESPYGYSKFVGELLCQQYAQLWNLNTVSLRYFNVYGKFQNPTGPYAAVVPKFLKLLEKNEPIIIFGDGTQTRDFVPVKTVVDSNLILGTYADKLSKEVFNIGTGKSITLLELVDRLKKQFPEYNNQIIFAPERPGDIKYSESDCTKYYEFLNQLESYNIETASAGMGIETQI